MQEFGQKNILFIEKSVLFVFFSKHIEMSFLTVWYDVNR